MTLIVGIKCAEGAVFCADGAATLGAMGVQTVRQPVRRKLSILHHHHNALVVGVSGPVGLGQRLQSVVDAHGASGRLKSKTPVQAMTDLRNDFWSGHIKAEMEAATVAQHVVGNQVAAASALATALVGLVAGKEFCIFQFDQQGAPEQLTVDLPFAAIGSGMKIADPFLAFLRRVLWPDRLPTLGDGITAALWTVQHAIQVSAGGVAEPIQLVLVTRQEDGYYRAREVPDAELGEHREAITAGEGALASWYSQLRGGGPASDLEPPPPGPLHG